MELSYKILYNKCVKAKLLCGLKMYIIKKGRGYHD